MGLGDLLKRLSKGLGGDEKNPVPAAGAAPRRKGGKLLPPIPTYLKKDKFLRAAEAAVATVTPAEEGIAETGSFKRPGVWLKNRLGGVSDSKSTKNIEKTTQALKKTGAFNDEEIRDFLAGLLDVAVPEEEASPDSDPPGKP